MSERRARRRGRLATAALLAAALLGGSPPASALLGDSLGLAPWWRWQTIETEHFVVNFPDGLEATARKEAGYLEEAHAVLSPKLYWKPWYKTQILVIDNADLANGLTTPQLRMGLVLWVTPPDPWFSTAYYDDWLRLLAFHEYTHLLNMDNVQDFYVPLRYLTGDVLLPNAAWPSWMLEGLAVFDETRYTHAGRGRSPYYEMVLRAAVASGELGESSFYKIDQFNGGTPYNPDGEAWYLFGYQLVNELARTPAPPDGKTADGRSPLRDGEDALGVMSLRSAARAPYFINGDLENIVGKSWYDLWDRWLAETRARMGAQLARIRAREVTEPAPLAPYEGITTIGPAPSPDGRYVAYTSDTPDRRSGLYLRDLRSGEARKLCDKTAGATSVFTPDSRSIVFSAVERYHDYYQFSELEAYDLAEGRAYPLSHGLRARDPDLSPDGAQVVFTLTENETTSLAVAGLARDPSSGRLRLGAVRKLGGAAARYDRATAPRFTRDGRQVVFSLHRNGRASEELLRLDLASGAVAELVANGRFNRYPAPAPDGSIYFASDLTGVENLYRLPPSGPPELVTNVTGGLATPALGPRGELYAAAYATHGWSVARIEPLKRAVAPADVTVEGPPAPRADEASTDRSTPVAAPAKSYSPLWTLLPRQWLLNGQFYLGGLYLEEDIAGFDATDMHDYFAAVGFNSQIPKADWAATYSNRQLGPTLTLYAADHTTLYFLNNQGITDYTRTSQALVQLSYIFQWTYSSLTPVLSAGANKALYYFRGYDPANGDLRNESPIVTTADLSFFYTDAETARLSVSAEEGRNLEAGVRLYSDPQSQQQLVKGIVKDTEYLRLWGHSVLVPSAKAMWSSGFDPDYADADATVLGRTGALAPNPLTGTFDPIGLRGYPGRAFYARSAAVGSLDLRVPLWQVFRGWGTNPVFVDNLYAFAFGDAAYFPSDPGVPALTAAGGGLTFRTEALLRLPLAITLECDQGLQGAYGGLTDLYLALNLGTLQF